jgi:flagellar protein FliS
MYTSTAVRGRQNRAKAYIANDVLDSTPEKLLLKIYDFAISRCKMQDLEKTNKALNELIGGLNYDTEEVSEVSVGLLKLYKYCQEEMRKKNYSIVEKILTELRESWYNILKQQGKI